MLLAVTQRKVVINETKEVRDSTDRCWYDFFNQCKVLPLLLPNNLSITQSLISDLKPQAICLTGGGDLSYVSQEFDKEREEVENFLIEYAIKNDLPLIAVCRGMQQVQNYFGIKLFPLKNHVMQCQQILIEGKREEVNSYHNFGTTENNDDEFEVFAISDDKIIKGIKHKKYNITAIMWHPERIFPFRKEDILLFQNILRKKYA